MLEKLVLWGMRMLSSQQREWVVKHEQELAALEHLAYAHPFSDAGTATNAIALNVMHEHYLAQGDVPSALNALDEEIRRASPSTQGFTKVVVKRRPEIQQQLRETYDHMLEWIEGFVLYKIEKSHFHMYERADHLLQKNGVRTARYAVIDSANYRPHVTMKVELIDGRKKVFADEFLVQHPEHKECLMRYMIETNALMQEAMRPLVVKPYDVQGRYPLLFTDTMLSAAGERAIRAVQSYYDTYGIYPVTDCRDSHVGVEADAFKRAPRPGELIHIDLVYIHPDRPYIEGVTAGHNVANTMFAAAERSPSDYKFMRDVCAAEHSSPDLDFEIAMRAVWMMKGFPKFTHLPRIAAQELGTIVSAPVEPSADGVLRAWNTHGDVIARRAERSLTRVYG